MFIQLFNDLPLSEHRDFSLYSIVISSLERLVRDNGYTFLSKCFFRTGFHLVQAETPPLELSRIR